MRLITAVMRFSILFGSITASLLSFILILLYHLYHDLSIHIQDSL
nr:MAG TPA: Picornaviridae P3A protein [Caudoviricetes sp.]